MVKMQDFQTHEDTLIQIVINKWCWYFFQFPWLYLYKHNYWQIFKCTSIEKM